MSFPVPEAVTEVVGYAVRWLRVQLELYEYNCRAATGEADELEVADAATAHVLEGEEDMY